MPEISRMASESGDRSGLALSGSAEMNAAIESRQTYSRVMESMLLLDRLCRRNPVFTKKGPNMSVLCQRNNPSTAIVRKRDISSNWEAGVTNRRPFTATALHLLDTLVPSRREKVLQVRRQIAEGTYDLDQRIDAVLDRLLKDLVA
jgi:hypothetical protein